MFLHRGKCSKIWKYDENTGQQQKKNKKKGRKKKQTNKQGNTLLTPSGQ